MQHFYKFWHFFYRKTGKIWTEEPKTNILTLFFNRNQILTLKEQNFDIKTPKFDTFWPCNAKILQFLTLKPIFLRFFYKKLENFDLKNQKPTFDTFLDLKTEIVWPEIKFWS